MPATTLDVFETTLHRTHAWIKEVMEELGVDRRPEAFLVWIAQEFPGDLDPDVVARAVFRVLARRVSEGEIEDVKHMLPASLRELWP